MNVRQNTICSELPMTIYHADGTVLANDVTEAEITDKGIFIVKSGDDCMKVLMK